MLSTLAVILLTQCATGITDNSQNLCGQKTFPDGAHFTYPIYLSGTYGYIQSAYSLYMRGAVPASDAVTPEFYFDGANYRANGPIMRVNNGYQPIMVLDSKGGLTLWGDEPIRVNGHSGNTALQAGTNGYLTIAGDLPQNYQGEHGAVTVVPGRFPCVGANLIQASSGRSGVGARTDYAFNVSCRGGIYSRDMITSSELPICNGSLPEPPAPNNRYGPCPDLADGGIMGSFGLHGPQIDGGYCHNWTTMYGPPTAKAGETFGFVADVEQGCQCVPSKYDGGASPAGWFKLSDRSECRP